MTVKSYAHFEEKLTCGLKKDLRNLANFHSKGMTLKPTQELCVMTMNNAKFEEFTCHFKTDMRNLMP